MVCNLAAYGVSIVYYSHRLPHSQTYQPAIVSGLQCNKLLSVAGDAAIVVVEVFDAGVHVEHQ